MKKIVNNNKCIIICHVENLKMSHVDPNILSKVFADIDVEYGKTAKMTITQSKIHK